MNKILTYVNLFGVLAMVLLSVSQWQTNDQINREADRLMKISDGQKTTIDGQKKTLADDAGQLDDLRGRLSAALAMQKTSEQKLELDTQQIVQLWAQHERLRASLDEWVRAVAARDLAIKQANEQIQKLSTDRRDAQQRLNDVIVKYNQLVKQ